MYMSIILIHGSTSDLSTVNKYVLGGRILVFGDKWKTFSSKAGPRGWSRTVVREMGSDRAQVYCMQWGPGPPQLQLQDPRPASASGWSPPRPHLCKSRFSVAWVGAGHSARNSGPVTCAQAHAYVTTGKIKLLKNMHTSGKKSLLLLISSPPCPVGTGSGKEALRRDPCLLCLLPQPPDGAFGSF